MNWGDRVMIFKALSSKSIKGRLPKDQVGFTAFISSMISRGLLLSDFKRYWWVSFIFGIALIAVLPLQVFLQGAPLPGEPWKKEMFMRILDLDIDGNGLSMILLLVVPVALATLLFNYMQTARSATMAHALPISRTTHFMTHSLAGIILLTTPILLTGMVMFYTIRTSFLGQFITVGDILQWACLYFIFSLFLFASAIFAGMFTGNSIAQMIFSYLLNVLPFGLGVLMQYCLGSLLRGYPAGYNNATMIRLLPVVNLFEGDRSNYMQYFEAGETNNRFGGYILACYFILSVVLLAVSLFLYKRRRLEAAGDIVSFVFARPVFKYGTAFCSMLLFAAYFSAFSDNQSGALLTGCAIGSFVGYVVAEMLLQKSFRVLKSYKGYLAFVAIVIVMSTIIKLDVIGYSSRIPVLSEVESVYFGKRSYDIEAANKVESENVEPGTQEQYIKNFTFMSTELNRSIIELHKAMADMKELGQESQGVSYTLGYRMKDGSHLIREYLVDEKQIETLLKPIIEAPEYKQALFPITGKKSEEITDIRLQDRLTGGAPVILSDSGEIEEFIDVIKLQVAGYSYEDIKGGRALSAAEISYRNSSRDTYEYYPIRSKDEIVIEWLRSKGYYEKVMPIPEKVDSITLENQYSRGRNPKSVEITDRKLIEKLVNLDFDEGYDPREEQVHMVFHTSRSRTGFSYPKKTLLEAGLVEYILELDQQK